MQHTHNRFGSIVFETNLFYDYIQKLEDIMSFEDILIHRDIPIKNGYVQIPPNNPLDNIRTDDETAVAAIPGSEIVELSLGSGRPTGSKHGQQRFLRLPGIRPNEWYTTDPIDNI